MIHSRHILPLALLCATATAGAQGFITDSQTGTLMIYRDPARQASTEIDAVVNNPAGTAFLPEGLSLSAGVSCDFGVQRAGIPGNSLFDYKSDSYTVGPVMQIAWRKGAVTLSASLGHTGGYGRRSLKGSPYLSFGQGDYTALNAALDELNTQLEPYIGYFSDFQANRVGLESVDNVASLYNWDGRLGVAVKAGSSLGVYVGVKVNRVYCGQSSRVRAAVELSEAKQYVRWGAYLSTITYDIMADDGEFAAPGQIPLTDQQKQYYVDRYLTLPAPEPEEYEQIKHSDNCLSLAPVLGIDLHTDAVNIGAKYEMASVTRHGAYKVPAMASAGVDMRTSAHTRMAVGASVVFGQEYFYGQAKDRAVYNVSASLSWLPVREWVLSGGLTYSYRNEWAPEAMPLPDADPHRLMFLSLGCAYNFNSQVQFNFGVRSGLGQTSFSTAMAEYKVRYPIQFAFGLNFHFKS